MQDRWFKAGPVMICLAMSLGWSTPVFATTYDVYPDSSCTLEMAVNAISTQTAINDPQDSTKEICAAGNGSDTINLASCQTDNTTPLEHGLKYCVDPDTKEALPPQDAATYVLNGQLVVGGDGNTSNITFGLIRDVFDKSIYPNAIIQAPANQRALFLYSGSSLTLNSITLKGSDISGNVDPVTDATQADFGKAGPNGGVIYARGSVTLSEGSLLTGGKAANGGGIYLDAGTGSLSLSLTNALINDNIAIANGGGVGTSATSSVTITGSQFNIFGNTAAKGGGIYLDGEGASLSLASGTLYGNTAAEGSAIDLVAGFAPGTSRASLLNNLTVTGNTGSAALHYSDLCLEEDSSTTPSTCGTYGPPRSQVLYAGVTDSIQPVAASTTVWLDVVKNDLSSSATIDCYVTPNCMTFDTSDTLTGSSVTVVYASEQLGGASDDSTFITTSDPGTVAAPDPTHTYPLVKYAPGPTYSTDEHDKFIYKVTKDALTTDGTTPSSVDLRAQVNLAVDAANLSTDDAPNEYVPDASMRTDFLYNSVVVNNVDGGCSTGSTTNSLSQYLENAYSITAGGGAGSTVGMTTGCPAAEQVMSPDIPGNWNNTGRADNADANVLSGGKPNGSGGTDTCTLVDAACEPLDFGKQYYHLEGFMPTDELRLLAANSNDPTLINAGSPDSTTSSWLCNSTDQRGHTRADRCDAGAVELGIAAGATDNLDDITTGQTTWLDVVKNDLGDETVDCTRIVDACLNFLLQSRYGSTLTVVYVAAPLADKVDGTRVFTTTTNPGVVAVADATHTYPLIQYVSAAGFHGQDQFMYEIPLGVLSGPAFAGVAPRAQVNLSVAPKDDFTSKDISDFKSGGIGVWMLLGLLLLGFARTVVKGRVPMKKNPGLGRLLLVSALLVSAGVAQADITVNDLGDPTDLTAVANDGKCTLREALQRSFESPGPNTDCDPGAPGTDTIILPEGTIILKGPLDISEGNSVVLQGKGVDKTIIDGDNQFRISTRSALTLQYLTFQHGSAGQGGAIFTISSLVLDHVALLDSTATQNGGAIYLSYGGDTAHTLSIDSSYIARNTAPSGGAIGTVGQSQQLAISISNSTFDGNSATGTCTDCKGGALDLNLAKNGSLGVINSIFTNNSAVAGASAIDLSNANASVSANLLNNTFYNNTGGAFLDSGANTNVILSNSIVAGDPAYLGCASAGGKLKGDYYNLYSDAEAPSCGASNTAVIAPIADITTALSGGALKPSTGSTTDYLPPLFWTASVTPEIIIDKGNPDGFSSGVVSPSTCRTTDMRGKSRNAGAACDIGAYEAQVMTAQDDAVTTLTSRSDGKVLTDREARADVLSNDLPGEGATGAYTIAPDKIGFLVDNGGVPVKTVLSPSGATTVDLAKIVAGSYAEISNDSPVPTTLSLPCLTSDDGTTCLAGITGTLSWLEMADGDPACDPGDDCGLRFNMTCDDLAAATGFSTCADLKDAISAGNINTTNDPNNLVCPDSTTPAIKVPYVAYDSNNNINNALLAITLSNLPPQFTNSTINIHTKPDEAVTFPLNVSDVDGVIASIGIADNGDPLFAAEDPALVEQKKQTGDISIHPAWGTGVVWNGSTTNPQITYIRGNKTQVFNDTFKIQVKDNCGGTSTVTVNVLFPQTEAAGGDLLNGGSLGWGLALLACFGLARRRRLRRT